jgi:malto-oligosyltrehalose trehalohydrolase
VLENDANQARFLASYTAQWNDDSHHAFHVLATGEKDGYYVDYADQPAKHLARCLAEGFSYQGDFSKFRNRPRGAASAHLPPTRFVDFLQNHDQVGNRAFGERLTALTDAKILRALVAMHLLAPSPPLLFMGEEWACKQPFLFFCDFPGELGEAVRKGRREEFARFSAFEDPAARERIPDPLAEPTFKTCVLDWKSLDRSWLKLYEELLALRQREIVPRLAGMKSGRYRMLTERAFEVTWGDLGLVANCGEQAIPAEVPPGARTLWGSPPNPTLQPWSVYWWTTP